MTSQFTGCDFVIHGCDFVIHGLYIAIHGRDFVIHGLYFAIHGRDFAIHGPYFVIHGRDFAIHSGIFSGTLRDLPDRQATATNAISAAARYRCAMIVARALSRESGRGWPKAG